MSYKLTVNPYQPGIGTSMSWTSATLINNILTNGVINAGKSIKLYLQRSAIKNNWPLQPHHSNVGTDSAPTPEVGWDTIASWDLAEGNTYVTAYTDNSGAIPSPIFYYRLIAFVDTAGGGVAWNQIDWIPGISTVYVYGAPQWVRMVNPTGSGVAYPSMMDTDFVGNIYICGYFNGTVNFGGTVGTLTATGVDLFIAKYDPTGTITWAKKYGGGGTEQPSALGVDRVTGTIYLATKAVGTVNVGGSDVTAINRNDILLSKYDTNGTFVTQAHFSTAGADAAVIEQVSRIRVDSEGNVYIAGFFTGSCTFHGGIGLEITGGLNFIPSVPPTGSTPPPGFLCTYSQEDSFLTKLDNTFAHIWSKNWNNGGTDFGLGLVIDSSDNPIISGSFQNFINFGGGNILASVNDDAYVAKFSGTDGSFVWAKGLTGGGQDAGNNVAVDSLDNVLLIGYFQSSSFSTGCGSVVKPNGVTNNGFVTLLSGVDGSCAWIKRFASDDFPNGCVAVAADGSEFFTVACTTSGSGTLRILDISGTQNASITTYAGGSVIVKFNAAGLVVWSKAFGGVGATFNVLDAIAGTVNLYFVAYQYGTVDYGNGISTTGNGSGAVALVKLFN